MICPEIRRIYSPDLDPPNLPEDPSNCEISFHAFIGARDGEGEEASISRSFQPRAEALEAQWGRGKLIVATFEWSTVVQAVAKLLAQCARPTWGEVVAELNKELIWKFDGHEPADA